MSNAKKTSRPGSTRSSLQSSDDPASTNGAAADGDTTLGGPGSSQVSLPESDLAPPADGKMESEESKLKQLLGILKKTIGVKDLGAMRLSLPANLMHPMPNLEYWHYLDRPDLFAVIDDYDDGLDRMLAVVRWALTKECKFIHGPVCKPYNSVLGERFRCIWDVDSPEKQTSGSPKSDASPRSRPSRAPTSLSTGSADTDIFHDATAEVDDAAASRSLESIAGRLSISKDGGGAGSGSRRGSTTGGGDKPCEEDSGPRKARVAFLNEQVSHHPPVSCFWYQSEFISGPGSGDGVAARDKKGKGKVVAHGVDQIGAKFTGTSVKVFPGTYNKGIFVHLESREEEYEITHPTANLTGLIRANPYVVIADHVFITCRGPENKRYRTIIQYIDESWIGKAKFAMEGVVHEVEGDGKKELEWTKLKQVPSDKVVAKFEGSWRGDIKLSQLRDDKSVSSSLVAPGSLPPLPKRVRDVDRQAPEESRRFWDDVTRAIVEKRYSEATRVKQVIEQRQRDIAAERQRKGKEFEPAWFQDGWQKEGKAKLTDEGWKMLRKELEAEGY